jgi:hypothetical protein
MDHVIFAPYRCPDQPLAWETRVRDDTSRVPLLAWFCELAVPAAITKREDRGWQIAGGVNFVEACRILQWMKELLANSQPILVVLQQKIAALTVQLQSVASPDQPCGWGK